MSKTRIIGYDRENCLQWMIAQFGYEPQYKDNFTALVEDCANHFQCNEVDGILDDPDHEIWDLPLEALDKFQKRKNNK